MLSCSKAVECNRKRAKILEKSKISALKLKLATGIEPVTSSLPMKCATDCAMPASYLLDENKYTILHTQLQQFIFSLQKKF